MRILVTGGTGMVGSAFKKIDTSHEIILLGSKDYDLTNPKHARKMVMSNRPDAVIHLAAKVGGVKGNTDYVSEFYSDNIKINTNLLENCHLYNVKKVVSLLSTCIYPNKVKYPLTPDQIHSGEPHPSNFGYAYAKRMLDIHSRALRAQYGRNYVTAVPNNMYGLNDNYDLNNGHVIPAVIRKIWESKINHTPAVFWGNGRTLREFSFAPDIARILLWMVDNYDDPEPLNIGNTGEISIMDIVYKVQKIMNHDKQVEWDSTMPAGQFRKPSDNSTFTSLYPDFKYTDIDSGLSKTCDWFIEKYPNIRGI